MRSDDLIAESPQIASPRMIDVCSAYSPALQKQSSANSFDVASYSRILQQVAKLYPYEHTAITASLSLSSPSSSSYHLPLYGSASPFQPLGAFSSALLQSDDNPVAFNFAALAVKEEISPDDISSSNSEKALDLSTQRGDSLPSPYRRVTLEQVKHKVVEDVWVENDRKLVWKDSKIAAFNPAQKLFMCLDCEHVGFLSRVAEHWLGSHANLRVFHCPRCPYTSAWSRCVKMHLTRHHNEQSADTTMWKGNPLLIEVTGLMQELRNKVEAKIDSNSLIADKRFYCPHCPYATDRRDLYTRHENIHKDDKPFHCYVCRKQFNRADHVKKHFVRMHADVDYDITKIRKSPNSSKMAAYTKYREELKSDTIVASPSPSGESSDVPSSNGTAAKLSASQSLQAVQPVCDMAATPLADSLIRTAVVPLSTSAERDGNESVSKTRRKGDKAFTCHYCNWSGSDNWCLKRHMNTHIKPFACVLCDYKAARAERLSTHVFKVHNKKICNKCSFLADTQEALQDHTREEHHNNPYSRRHICSTCGMSFDTKANLETHTHLSHTRPHSPQDIVEITPIPMSDKYQGLMQKLAFKENLDSFGYSAESELSRFWSSTDVVRDLTRADDSQLIRCPHCEYKLTPHQASREHWLEHHEDVCGACVHVFTSVYGPQVWKKVVDRPDGRPESTEKLLDAGVLLFAGTKLGKYQQNLHSPNDPTAITISSSCLLRQVDNIDQDRSTKRSRKQSYPKKVITQQTSPPDHSLERAKRAVSKKRVVFRCKRCPNQPKFRSIAQFKLHKMKRHTQLRLKQTIQRRMRIKRTAKS